MSVQNPPQGAVLVVNTPGGLYLRVSPSVQANWQAAMPQGAQVIATGNESNGFAEVLYQGVIKGWASEQYLDLMQVQQAQQQVAQVIQNVMQPAQQQMQNLDPKSIAAGLKLSITGQDVALRSAPAISVPAFGQGSNVIFLTSKGETATTIGPMQNGFTMVSVRSQEGWLSTQYLSDVPPVGIVARPPQQPPAITVNAPPPQPKTGGAGVSGSAGFVLGLGILVAVGYFMMK